MADSKDANDAAPAPDVKSSLLSNTLRIAFAGVLGAIGLITFVGNGVLLGYRVLADKSLPWHEVPFKFQIWEVEFRVVIMVVGLAWVLSSSLINQRRVKVGWIVAGVALLVLQLNAPTNRALRHHFAGDSFKSPVRVLPPY